MELIVLGSGTNVPTERACAGYLVKADVPIVMDMGYRTFSNLCNVQDRSEISHILISHMHVDHYGDFPTFFQNANHESKERQRKDLNIIGPKGSKEIFTKILSFPGLNAGKFKTSLTEVADKAFDIGRAHVMTKEVKHVDNLHCNGYRIEYQGKSIAYSGDSRLCNDIVELCRNADVAVLDCSVPKGFPKEHHLGKNHLGVTDCGTVAKRAGVKKLILSHIYPQCKGHDLVKECKESFDGEIIVAKDLMRIKI